MDQLSGIIFIVVAVTMPILIERILAAAEGAEKLTAPPGLMDLRHR